MPISEEQDEKLFYSISEVAKRFNVNASLIRFWEKEFDIIKPQKNKKGNRLFTKQDVESFYVIYNLVKERGFTLQGAKEQLKQNKGEVFKEAEVIQSLQKIKDFLMELKKNL